MCTSNLINNLGAIIRQIFVSCSKKYSVANKNKLKPNNNCLYGLMGLLILSQYENVAQKVTKWSTNGYVTNYQHTNADHV